ncbi:carbohydrate ABC transporter permease [Acidihalobacter ferrooxydans]|uniref:carbohydrate ABC transporter permease n=1 Tax=Acidihalobacter ferrooxydans TaxID=1765967 RepID=UPI0018DD96FC|nr:sugar ABC transporter permease [Acidihalobacter ferrooxydans]
MHDTASTPAASAPRGLTLQRRRVIWAWVFLSPVLIALILVALWPLVTTFINSLTNASFFGGQARFVGLHNFLHHNQNGWGGVLASSEWWRAVRNTALFTVVTVTTETLVGLMLALVLDSNLRGSRPLRAAVLIPWAIPTVVSSEIWTWMLQQQGGIINVLLMNAHLIHQPIDWLSNPALMLPAVMMVDIWKTTPFMALLILAGLQTIPQDIYEAARVDGVGPLKTFWRITLPLVWPAVLVAVIFRMLDALRVFDVIYVMTGAVPQTETMAVYIQNHLVSFGEIGYASAASVVMFLFMAVLLALIIWGGRKRLLGESR